MLRFVTLATAATLSFGLSMVTPSIAAAPPTPTLKAEKTTLPNGLEVILEEDHRTPLVTVNIWYHVGSKDEPEHRSGFAHLFEHMMFQGSKHVPEDTYFRFLEKVGSSTVNGTTNTDRTNYFETIPANQLETALWLESDRMGFLLDHAGEETFKSQREVVKNERRQNYENAPYAMTRQYIHEELFPKDHPYHQLTIGSMADLDAATIDDVRGFFRRFYVPNNATIAISGDIQRGKVLGLVDRYFGPIPRGADVIRRKPVPVPHPGEARIEVEAGVELPRVYVSWVTPPYYAAGDAELDLFAKILASGKTSRLHKRLMYDSQIAQSVTANQSSMELASVFEIVATVKPGHTADEVLKAIDEELAKARAGVTEQELARVRTGILAEGIFELEKSTTRANRLNHYNHYTGDPNFLAKDLSRSTAATPELVVTAAKTWIREKDRVVTIVTPKKGAPVAGQLVTGKK